MLETLGAAATVRDAAATLAAHYGRPLPEIEEDLYEFCLSLHDRGLVELIRAWPRKWWPKRGFARQLEDVIRARKDGHSCPRRRGACWCKSSTRRGQPSLDDRSRRFCASAKPLRVRARLAGDRATRNADGLVVPTQRSAPASTSVGRHAVSVRVLEFLQGVELSVSRGALVSICGANGTGEDDDSAADRRRAGLSMPHSGSASPSSTASIPKAIAAHTSVGSASCRPVIEASTRASAPAVTSICARDSPSFRRPSARPRSSKRSASSRWTTSPTGGSTGSRWGSANASGWR